MIMVSGLKSLNLKAKDIFGRGYWRLRTHAADSKDVGANVKVMMMVLKIHGSHFLNGTKIVP